MLSYALKVRMPKNSRIYLDYVKRSILEECKRRRMDCVIEFLDGRILLFSDSEEIEKLVRSLRGFISIHKVEIFHDEDALVDAILKRVNGCKSFAIRSNKKDVEREIGAIIVEKTGIAVNLENPNCEIVVEKRGKVFLLFE